MIVAIPGETVQLFNGLRIVSLLSAQLEQMGAAAHGRTARRNYLGSLSNVGLQVGKSQLVVSLPRDANQVAEGQDATICWPYSAGILLPEASLPAGKRVRA